MRVLSVLLLFTIINCVLSKNNVKSLTESMGQEVIEIGNQLKELPPDLEEEPSAENYEENKSTTTTQAAGTKRDVKKPGALTTPETRRKNKEVDKSATKEDDEEARIEKELAEIYRDNADYKADSSEVIKEVTTEKALHTEKPILRNKPKNFKFQPDSDSKAEVERFRTSIDEISCDKNRMKGGDTFHTAATHFAVTVPNSASANTAYFLISLLSFISASVVN